MARRRCGKCWEPVTWVEVSHDRVDGGWFECDNQHRWRLRGGTLVALGEWAGRTPGAGPNASG